MDKDVFDRRPLGAPGVFYQGLAIAVDKSGKYFHIRENGEPAYEERFDLVEYFQNGLAWVKKGDLWIRIDETGKEVPMKNTTERIPL